MNQILSIKSVHYTIGKRKLFSVSNLSIEPGEVIHLLGDSGTGKSLFGLSLIGFYSSQSEVEYEFDAEMFTKDNWRTYRNEYVGYIFQQPKSFFNPVITCGNQLLELLPKEVDKKKNKEIIIDWCRRLKLNITDRVFKDYPHQFSIGQLQRLYVISALIRSPKLIVADEPFAHLDWSTASIVANTLSDYVASQHAGLLLISHELPGSLITPNRIWKLEDGAIKTDLYKPKPRSRTAKKKIRKHDLSDKSTLITIRQIYKVFNNNASALVDKRRHVLSNISFSIKEGDRIGLMGLSGSGKTTLASIITGLEEPTSGNVEGAHEVSYNLRSLFKRRPSMIQMVFQDPYSSFNPSQSVADQIAKKDGQGRLLELMQKMGLRETDMHRTPMALSGGELQRFSLIRSLTVSPAPRVLILDEALSALDERTQNIVLELLHREYPSLAILFISHRYWRLTELCDEIYFLHDGELIHHLSDFEQTHSELPEVVQSLIGKV